MISIRPARHADCRAIWELHSSAIRQVCGRVYPAEQIEAWAGLLAPDRYQRVIDELVVVVAEDDLGVVGFGQLDPARCLIQAVYVLPDRLRSGLGRALLGELERRARASGCRELWLMSTLNAVPFYEAMGFGRVGDAMHELPEGTRLPCVEMSRPLGEA